MESSDSSIKLCLLIALIMMLTAGAAFAKDYEKEGTFSLVVENDIYHSDKYYTNGVRAAWLTSSEKVPLWAIKAADMFPLFPIGSTLRGNFAVGQNMYTSKDIKEEHPPKDERPYAGWLYGSVGLIAETGKRLDQLEFTFGVVGPGSLAEPTQKAVHEVIGSPKPKGWDYQLKNEPGFVLTYQRSWRSYVSKSFLGVPFDITPNAGFALGNVYTYASTGAVIRYGMNLPMDYGPPRIAPSLPGSNFFITQEKFGWYLFAGIEGRYVVRNIFLDGNTFAKSRSVEKEPIVGDFQMGIAVTKGRWRLSYMNIVRTKEYKGQDTFQQSFGAVSLSVQM